MQENGEYKLFVKNLPWSCDEDMLYNTFAKYGEVTFTRLCVDMESGRSRGFGFVSFSSQENGEEAEKNLNGFELDGRSITVAPATRRERNNDNNARGGFGDKPCYAFQKGQCSRGDSCKFSHNGAAGGNGGYERRPQGVCFAFQKGECNRGDSCKFSHSADAEAAPRSQGACFAFQRGECNRGDGCRFSHGSEEAAPATKNNKKTFDDEEENDGAEEPEEEKVSSKRKASEDVEEEDDAEDESDKKSKKSKKDKKEKKAKKEKKSKKAKVEESD